MFQFVIKHKDLLFGPKPWHKIYSENIIRVNSKILSGCNITQNLEKFPAFLIKLDKAKPFDPHFGPILAPKLERYTQ